MSNTRRQIFGAYNVVKGATWTFDVLSLSIGGDDVTAPQLAAATVTGSIAGVAVTSSVADPETGVRLRVICAPVATAAAVPADAPYPSDIRIEFSPTEVHKLRLLITVLDSPTT